MPRNERPASCVAIAALVAIGVSTACTVGGAGAAIGQADGPVTFTRHVAPILYNPLRRLPPSRRQSARSA